MANASQPGPIKTCFHLLGTCWLRGGGMASHPEACVGGLNALHHHGLVTVSKGPCQLKSQVKSDLFSHITAVLRLGSPRVDYYGRSMTSSKTQVPSIFPIFRGWIGIPRGVKIAAATPGITSLLTEIQRSFSERGDLSGPVSNSKK